MTVLRSSASSPLSRSGRLVVLGLILLMAVSALVLLALTPGPELRVQIPREGAPPAAPGGARPNIVVIMTDDQHEASMRETIGQPVEAMKNVRELLAERGTNFTNSFASYPLCCPSRATFLTGQYAHNNKILANKGPNGGYAKFADLHGNDNLATWLNSSGYHTALIGKFLNGYGKEAPEEEVPPGWSEWHGLVHLNFYDYRINENGTVVTYGDKPEDYQTDVLTKKAEDFIQRQAVSDKPFFLWMSYFAPHDDTKTQSIVIPGPEPAPRHKGLYKDLPLPQPASFNEADITDKPSYLQGKFPEPLNKKEIEEVRISYRRRMESLLAVDEGVKRILDALEKAGKLENTVVIFTSDNGFFHGEHRAKRSKLLVYEPSIRVPLIIRGGGFPRGRETGELTVNVDLAPTILELAQVDLSVVSPDHVMDGRPLSSLIPSIIRDSNKRILMPERAWRTAFLLEAALSKFILWPFYTAVRTDRYVYVEYDNDGDGLYADGEDKELYDLELDPDQLESRHNDPAFAGIREKLQGVLKAYRNGAGDIYWRGAE